MLNRKTAMVVALLIIFSPAGLLAQTSAKKKAATAVENGASGKTEPLRVINGEMRGRTVRGQVKQNSRSTTFSFTITKADVVNGRLQLTGDFALGGARAQAGHQVTATIAGIMSKAADPWPSANNSQGKDPKKSKEEEKKAGEQQQGREAKSPETASQLGQLAQSTQDTARKTPPAPGEKTEQSQSLYAQAEAVTGCGIMFLRLTLPDRLRAKMGRVAEPLQLGVLLKPFDNELGEEINRAICRLLHRQQSRDQSASLSQLNRLLTTSN
jgi:hypothetical protein